MLVLPSRRKKANRLTILKCSFNFHCARSCSLSFLTVRSSLIGSINYPHQPMLEKNRREIRHHRHRNHHLLPTPMMANPFFRAKLCWVMCTKPSTSPTERERESRLRVFSHQQSSSSSSNVTKKKRAKGVFFFMLLHRALDLCSSGDGSFFHFTSSFSSRHPLDMRFMYTFSPPKLCCKAEWLRLFNGDVLLCCACTFQRDLRVTHLM